MSPASHLHTHVALPSAPVALIALLLIAALAVAAPAPASADGGGFACVHHGDKRPGKLRTKQARNAGIECGRSSGRTLSPASMADRNRLE